MAADALDKQVRIYRRMMCDVYELVYRADTEVPAIVASAMLKWIMNKLFRIERRLYQTELQRAYLATQIDFNSGG